MQPDVESGKEEKMEVIRIDDNSWRIEDEGVRFFLLTGDEKALLVDSGMTISNAKEIAEGLTSLPISLVNTHTDPDHIGSNDEFDFFYIHPAEAVNYYNVQKRNGNFIPVEDGYIFNLGNRKLRVISIPGHTPGSIALLDEERRNTHLRGSCTGWRHLHVRYHEGIPCIHRKPEETGWHERFL